MDKDLERAIFTPYMGNIEDLFKESEKITFLVGAGISKNPPSSVPSAREFVNLFFDLYAPPKEKDRLNQLNGLRYEIVVDKIYEVFDQNYKFMDYFELLTEPNLLHYFLAYALINHQFVITTNFDYLIEYAYKRIVSSEKFSDLIPVITQMDFIEFKDPYNLMTKGKFPYYKIHGSCRNVINGKNTQESLIISTTTLGKNKEQGTTFAIEPYKKEVLNNLVKGRTLVVMGYSGSDDFDISPTLLELRDIKRIVWIDFVTKKGYLTFGNVETVTDQNIIKRLEGMYALLVKIKAATKIETIHLSAYTYDFVKDVIWPALFPKNDIESVLTPEILDRIIEKDFATSLNELLEKKSKPSAELMNKKEEKYPIIPSFTTWAGNNLRPQPLVKKYKFACELYHELGDFYSWSSCSYWAGKEADKLTKEYGYSQSGLNEMMKGNFNIAMTYLTNAIRLDEELTLDNELAINLANLGKIEYLSNDLSSAKVKLDKAFNIVEGKDDPRLKISIFQQMVDYYIFQKDFRKALEIEQQCLAIDEQTGNLHNKALDISKIYQLYLFLDEMDKASKIYNEGFQLARTLGDLDLIAEYHCMLGRYYQKQKQIVSAIDNFNQALDVYQKTYNAIKIASTLTLIGDTYSSNMNYTKALPFLTDAYDRCDKITDNYFAKQFSIELSNKIKIVKENMAHEKTKDSEIIEECRKQIENNSLNEIAWVNWGSILIKIGKFSEAIEKNTKAININAKNDIAWTNLGIALNKLGNYNEAIEKCVKAVEINPRNDVAWTYWGSILVNLGKFNDALEKCAKAVEINPRNDIALTIWASALYNLGKKDETIEKCAKAIEINTRNDTAMTLWASVLINLYKIPEAINKCVNAVEINPQNDDAWLKWGIALTKQNWNYKGAIEKYAKAVEINPQNGDAWRNWGEALSWDNKFDDAIEKCVKAVEINPKDANAWAKWGECLFSLGKYNEGNEKNTIAVKINPQDDSIWHYWAHSLFQIKKYDEALEKAKKAIEINPKNDAKFVIYEIDRLREKHLI